MQLALSQLKIDGGTQPRVAISETVVGEYAEALRDGAIFPPVVVFHDGTFWWLADGFHRYHAHRQAGVEKIEADVRVGTLRDAILFALGANTEHGLRRTNADKRRAVETMLTNEVVAKDDGGNPWSDREVARLCRVHHDTVGRIRTELSGGIRHIDTTSRAVKRGDQTYVQNTARIRRSNRARRNLVRTPHGEFDPRRLHAEDGPVPMRSISLPLNDPSQAAKIFLARYGKDYVRQVVDEWIHLLKDKTGAVEPIAPEAGCIPAEDVKSLRAYMRDVRRHRTPIELPHDPHAAVQVLVKAMGLDYVRALRKALIDYLETISPKQPEPEPRGGAQTP
jgi:hypothetical protein